MSRFIRLETVPPPPRIRGTVVAVVLNVDRILSIRPDSHNVVTDDHAQWQLTPHSLAKLLKEVGCDE
jgi:hypothetical protein